jgi:hypothetical protein
MSDAHINMQSRISTVAFACLLHSCNNPQVSASRCWRKSCFKVVRNGDWRRQCKKGRNGGKGPLSRWELVGGRALRYIFLPWPPSKLTCCDRSLLSPLLFYGTFPLSKQPVQEFLVFSICHGQHLHVLPHFDAQRSVASSLSAPELNVSPAHVHNFRRDCFSVADRVCLPKGGKGGGTCTGSSDLRSVLPGNLHLADSWHNDLWDRRNFCGKEALP